MAKIKKPFVFIGALLFAVPAFADNGFIVTNARITKIGSVSGGADTFWIEVADGTGICNGDRIYFYASNFANAEAQRRTFSLLTAAALAGKKVSVYTYLDTQVCSRAGEVEFSP